MSGDVVRVPHARVFMSTASVYPETTPVGFEMAARLGYDGVEVMVSGDPVSQDLAVLRRLADYHSIPIVAIHAPCLLLTQRVWGRDPWEKLVRAREVAESVGARAVVVHPPFRWQRDYSRDFVSGLERMQQETDVVFAVENMFPIRAGGREVVPYAPGWSPLDEEYQHVTLDVSHAAVSGSDALAMAKTLDGRLAHVHMADGVGIPNKDEHLVPGRGAQPCTEVLEYLARMGYEGMVVVEINTHRALDRDEREADLTEALAFTRLNLATARAGADGGLAS